MSLPTDVDTLIALAEGGDLRALARLISVVENDGHQAQQVVEHLYPRTGRAHIVGVTGAPGTGKSTLVNAIARIYRQRGHRVGIVAIDPTSPFSGGALLGDRVRMRDLIGDPDVFIRSMATRGSLGGLAHATDDVVMILDAMGYDRILIETVGVGQAEVDIAASAHSVIVVEAPGLGDDVQAIKAGVLEIADIFVVNKADREGADRTFLALQTMLGLGPRQVPHHGRQMSIEQEAPPSNWTPPILKTVATRGEGVDAVVDAIEHHREHLQTSGEGQHRETTRVRREIYRILQDTLLTRLIERVTPAVLDDVVHQVVARKMDPYTAAQRLIVRSETHLMAE